MAPTVPPHPGEVLREILEQRGISQSQAADSLGMSRGHLNSIINGHNPISADLKLKLQDLLDIPTQHWSRLQEQHHRFADSDEGQKLIKQRDQQSLLHQLELKTHPQLLMEEIRQAEACKWLVIEPFEEAQLTRSGYWLTLGLHGSLTNRNDRSKYPVETEVILKPELTLKPGEVLTLLCREKLRFPRSLHVRVSTEADAFCDGSLTLRTRRYFESGLQTSLSLHMINETARPQTVRFQQQAVHIQFDFFPADEPDPPAPAT
jgi:addiction module HigA family antidote